MEPVGATAIRPPPLTARGWIEPLTTLLVLAALVGMAVDVGFTPSHFDGVADRLRRLAGAAVPLSAGGEPLRLVVALGDTMAMAFVGTVLGAMAALPLGLIGAKTLVPQRVAHFGFRRFLDLFRGVPVLVWALILVSAFGLGPFAGVCALALADTPHLAKLFAEAIEAVDRKPIEGVRAAGASPLQVVRLGVLPQVAPVMASQCLFFLESNFRHAVVLGIVGAGGIGYELEEHIRIFDFHVAGFIILLYMGVVAALDTVSRELRKRLA
jgi:phosphonate transport system permease protein